MKAGHSSSVMPRCRWLSPIERPEYNRGPPAAPQSISVTKYLKPAGETRWCASSTAGFLFSRGSVVTRSMKSSTTVAML